MIKKKICMLGAFSVGKTSLVQRFVKSMFSDKYLTTVGVKIDKKTISVNGQEVNLLLWDIYGEDNFQKVQMSYIRGASGYFLVVDGTRRSTLNTALELRERVEENIGNVPFILLFNKSDLEDEWEIDDEIIDQLSEDGLTVLRTSAKTGTGVEDAFLLLANKMLEG
ncbi:Rab family GTPase [Desulfonema magnum]|uniref:GTP-binding protein n=1 Tax=Desulfonema magnum TaxID=45655 RepID=A0A975BS26_9BACT|nr:Rab family GTPase [Desulfonema magnum]QTA90363.1 GTP-binding protein [Desulfonema magnum]